MQPPYWFLQHLIRWCTLCAVIKQLETLWHEFYHFQQRFLEFQQRIMKSTRLFGMLFDHSCYRHSLIFCRHFWDGTRGLNLWSPLWWNMLKGWYGNFVCLWHQIDCENDRKEKKCIHVHGGILVMVLHWEPLLCLPNSFFLSDLDCAITCSKMKLVADTWFWSLSTRL